MRRTAAAVKALASVGGGRAAHFVLNSKGPIGSRNRGLTEGLTGHFNPGWLKGGGDKSFVTFSPEDGEKSWMIGSGIAVYQLLERHLGYATTETRLGEDAPLALPLGAKRDLEAVSNMGGTRWLSALTSALLVAGRAWNPIEPRAPTTEVATLVAATKPWRQLRSTVFVVVPLPQARAMEMPPLTKERVKRRR